MTATDLDAALVLLIDGDRYALAVLPREGLARVYGLLKEGSSRAPYEVRDSPGRGQRCTCPGHQYGRGRSCRHIKALRKVGLL